MGTYNSHAEQHASFPSPNDAKKMGGGGGGHSPLCPVFTEAPASCVPLLPTLVDVITFSLSLSLSLSLLYSVPQITEEPKSLENVTPGKPAEFFVKANGKNLTYTWHRQTAKQPNDKRVVVGDTQILCIDEVESSDEGYYVCTISNPTGGSVETNTVQLTTSM